LFPLLLFVVVVVVVVVEIDSTGELFVKCLR